MLKKVINKFKDVKEEYKKRKEERARIERERAEEEAKKERERVQAEKDALMALSEKELIVEIMMVLRGYNTRLKNIEEKQDDLKYRLDSLDSNISRIGSSVDEMK